MSEERYVFTATGHEEVKRAFSTIGDAAERSGARVERAFSGGIKAGGAGRQGRVVRDTERLGLRVAAAQEKARMRELRDQQRHTQRMAREHAREGQNRIKAETKFLHDKMRLERAANKEAVRQAERAQREQVAARRRSTAAIGSVMSVAGRTALGAVAAVGAAGAYYGHRMLGESVSLQDRATRIAVAGGAKDPTELRRGFERTAQDVKGVRADDVASGVQAYVSKTGDLDAARRYQRLFAEVGMATGSDIGDVGNMAAALAEKFKISTEGEMRQALASVAVQGKRGSFEISDAAGLYDRITASAEGFGIGGGVEGVQTVSGLTQIARSATGSGEQAATAVEALFRQLRAKQGEFAKMGVNFRDKDGKQRDIKDILTDVVSKTRDKKREAQGLSREDASAAKLQSLLGDEGIRGIRPLLSAYSDAVRQGKDGLQVLRDEFAKATDASGAVAEIMSDLAISQKTSEAQLTAAWESMKATLSTVATPAIAKLAQQLGDLGTKADLRKLGHGVAEAAKAAAAFAKGAYEFAVWAELIDPRSDDPEAHRAEEAVARKNADVARGKADGIVTDALLSGRDLTPEEQKQVDALRAHEKEATAGADMEAARAAVADAQNSMGMFGSGTNILYGDERRRKFGTMIGQSDVAKVGLNPMLDEGFRVGVQSEIGGMNAAQSGGTPGATSSGEPVDSNKVLSSFAPAIQQLIEAARAQSKAADDLSRALPPGQLPGLGGIFRDF